MLDDVHGTGSAAPEARQTAGVGDGELPLPTVWLTATEARARLSIEIDQFFADVLAWDAATGETAPALALRVTAGVGKTTAVLAVRARLGEILLALGWILVLMPTLDLAERARAEFGALRSGLPSMVLRGRAGISPATVRPLCMRHKDAAKLALISASVTAGMCERRNEAGPTLRAECRQGCGYFWQFQGRPKVVFLAHAYLATHLPLPGEIALRVIDESFFTSLISAASLTAGEWLDPKAAAAPGAARHAVLQALEERRSPIEALACVGFDKTALLDFAEAEEQSAPEVAVFPTQSAEAQRHAMDEVDAGARARARFRARIWQALADAFSTGACERVTWEQPTDGSGEGRLHVHGRKPLPDDAPLLIIDADADRKITAAFAPQARFVAIDAAPTAEIWQVSDRTLSDHWLLHHKNAKAHRRQLRVIIEAEVRRSAGHVLVVATKCVLRALHQDESSVSGGSDAELLAPLFGALPRWFGPRMRGINDYKHWPTVIIAGRLEPHLNAVEATLRAIHGDSGKPLTLFERDERGNPMRHVAEGAIHVADGSARQVNVSTHPDPRGAAILAQIREAGSTQAIARIRAVGAATPKRILVLSSIPLGLPVTRAVKWADLADSRLARCICTPDGGLRIGGLRLSSAGLAADAPHEFPSTAAATSWRRGTTTEALIEEVVRIASDMGVAVTQLALSVRGKGGKSVPGVVFTEKGFAERAAKSIWPEYSVDGALTSASQKISDHFSSCSG